MFCVKVLVQLGENRRLLECVLKKESKSGKGFVFVLLPNGQGEVSYVLLAGTSQKAAMDASGLEHFFGL